MPTKVTKRDGRLVKFDISRIVDAVHGAMGDAGVDDKGLRKSRGIADIVSGKLDRGFKKAVPGVEDIQDLVEETLMKEGYPEVARNYILYRNAHRELRLLKSMMGVYNDELKMSPNAISVLNRRYLIKDQAGKITETPTQMFARVATAIAKVDRAYKENAENSKKAFYDMMSNRLFLPNSPTLMNAGTGSNQLSACFVLPVGDSLDSIFDAVYKMVKIQQTGGGTGFSFSQLRPEGDFVKTTQGVASGPVSFIKVFNAATEAIKQGGKRRGANMGILSYDHPDIEKFISVKLDKNELTNFNISVSGDDKFMKAVADDSNIELINPRTNAPVRSMNARVLFDRIVSNAWKTGDPGLIFIDEINRHNPLSRTELIEATNPCVTGDTLISTAEGLFTARALYEAARPIAIIVDSRFGAGAKQISSPVILTGTKPVVRLTTKEGFMIRLTSDHKIYSEERGWVAAGELRNGEMVRISNTGGAFGRTGTAKEGKVLGWLVGGGHINMGGGNDRAVLPFYCDYMEIAGSFAHDVNSVIRRTESMNGANNAGIATIQQRKRKAIASERLKEFALRYGIGEQKLKVPEAVFNGSEGMQRGFMQALFEADGTIGKQRGSRDTVRLTSISEGLLRGVQLLLLNFDVHSRICMGREKAGTKMMTSANRMILKGYKTNAVHELSISGPDIFAFATKIGFISESKTARLNEAIGSYIRKPYTDKIKFVATVESLVEDGIEDVYDLQERVTHSFIGNGIVIHNCGEQPLLPYESCNLGSINLSKLVKNNEVEWSLLEDIVAASVHFLDNVIDANTYIFKEIDYKTKANRKIGLGIMGWADMLTKLGIRYDSTEALSLAGKLMSFIQKNAKEASMNIAIKRGSFPNFEQSTLGRDYKAMRNATVTTIAPTGTISIIANASGGIEPLFAISYVRNVMEGTQLMEVNDVFSAYAKRNGFYSEELMNRIAVSGSLRGVGGVPSRAKDIFVSAFDISPEWHVRMQAAFQKHVDNAVSKTVNLPNEATTKDVADVYMLAHKLKCKGVTVYRYGSKENQVLSIHPGANVPVIADSEYSGGCPYPYCER